MEALWQTRSAFGVAWWFIKFSISVVIIWSLILAAWYLVVGSLLLSMLFHAGQ
jgi:hypothetical protein